MNKIAKSTPVPDILLTRGEELKAELIEQADNGETNLSFCSEVYADSTVKDRLKSDQHNKCSYCERYLNGDFGDVEHFRPKKSLSAVFRLCYKQTWLLLAGIQLGQLASELL